MNQNSANFNAESAQKALEEVSAFFKKRLVWENEWKWLIKDYNLQSYIENRIIVQTKS